MFSIPGKQAVTITPRAAGHIARLMQRQNAHGLRIGVKKGGCAGMEYTMDYVAEANPLDEVVEQDGARVMIAPMAQMFLFGTEIDFETSLLESGFWGKKRSKRVLWRLSRQKPNWQRRWRLPTRRQRKT